MGEFEETEFRDVLQRGDFEGAHLWIQAQWCNNSNFDISDLFHVMCLEGNLTAVQWLLKNYWSDVSWTSMVSACIQANLNGHSHVCRGLRTYLAQRPDRWLGTLMGMGDDWLHHIREIPDYETRISRVSVTYLRRAVATNGYDTMCYLLTYFSADEFWDDTIWGIRHTCAPLIQKWTERITPKRAHFMTVIAPELVRRVNI